MKKKSVKLNKQNNKKKLIKKNESNKKFKRSRKKNESNKKFKRSRKKKKILGVVLIPILIPGLPTVWQLKMTH